MSYSTPHHAHEFLKAACLSIVHEYVLACQRRPQTERSNIVLNKREIDINSRLAMHFGPEAAIAAQGTSAIDLSISSPKIRAELKFLRRKPGGKQPVNLWNAKKGVKHDWDWLLGLKNTGDNFKKSALVFFFPSQNFHQFHEVCDLRASGTTFVKLDYAPFLRLVRVDTHDPKKLIYRKSPPQDLIIKMGSKVMIRRQMVGSISQPLWALIFSRVGTHEYESLTSYREVSV